jgi:hypothetical protein
MTKIQLAFRGWFAVILLGLASCGGGGGGGGGSFSSGPISLGLAVADFNGDGQVDLAIAYTVVDHAPPHPSTVGVALHQGAGAVSFGSATSYPVGSDTWNTIAADVDGDGLPDIVSVDYSAGTLSLLLNNASQPGHFQPAKTFSSGQFLQQVAAADVNQDGHVDLIVAHSGGIAIHLQHSSAPGSFAAASMIAIDSCCGGLAVGDLNGDGLTDVVVVDQGQTLRILFQDPGTPGAFLAPVSPVAGMTGAYVTIADVNGDGAADLIFAGIPTSTGPSASIVVALQDHAHPGQFLPPTTYATTAGVRIILARDLNGDGHTDLVVGTNSGIGFLYQDSARPGQFFAAQNYSPYFTNNTTGDHISYDFSYIGLGDVNGDGLLDIIVNIGPSFGTTPGVILQTAGHAGQFGSYQDLH